MRHAHTRDVGLDVHQDSIAVADVATEHAAEVICRGTMGPRQADMEQRMRAMPSTATPLVCVYAAGPCGSWLARDLTPTGHVCGVVAPSLMPNKAGDRGNTERRDAVHRARLRRAGDLTPVDVPAVADEALRALSRAREETLHDLQTAPFRLHAFLRRHASR